MEQEVKFKDCFGTFDQDDATRGCSDCSDNAQCQSYAPQLANHKAAASEQSVNAYIATTKQETQLKLGKLIAYSITILILVLVFWEASKAL